MAALWTSCAHLCILTSLLCYSTSISQRHGLVMPVFVTFQVRLCPSTFHMIITMGCPFSTESYPHMFHTQEKTTDIKTHNANINKFIIKHCPLPVQTHAHTHMHAHMYTHMCMCTHTHTHTHVSVSVVSPKTNQQHK